MKKSNLKNSPIWMDDNVYHIVAKETVANMPEEILESMTDQELRTHCMKAYHRHQQRMIASIPVNPFVSAAKQLLRG